MKFQYAIGFSILLLFLTGKSLAVDPQQVAAAIERGVSFLKSAERDGRWPNQKHWGMPVGVSALAGLALLESGVSPSDPVVQRVAAVVRNQPGLPQEGPGDDREAMRTYVAAVTIMFLDKLIRLQTAQSPQRADDSKLILAIGRYLCYSQGEGGTWGYGSFRAKDGDHSNTQFADLAVWIACQHGLKGEDALRRCAEHFRSCQSTYGGWSYCVGSAYPRMPDQYAAMTCAGLMALATDEGRRVLLTPSGSEGGKRRSVPRDKAVSRAMNLLSGYLVHGDLGWLAQPAGAGGTDDLYFFWSIERVGVLFGREKIGRYAWYEWGTRRLLAPLGAEPFVIQDGRQRSYVRMVCQQPDGSWNSVWGPVADTSFALLFLTRANVAPELTRLLSPQYGDGAHSDSGRTSSELRQKPEPVQAGTTPVATVDRSVAELLEALEDARSLAERRGLIDELARRRPTYAVVKDQLGSIAGFCHSRDAETAAAACDQLANAFERAPISHALYWIGQWDKQLAAIVWEQLDRRIGRARNDRRQEYIESAVAVLGHAEFSMVGREAAIEFLVRLDDRRSAEPVANLLLKLPEQLWPAAGGLLRKLTGEEFGPREGDGIAEVLEAQKQWQAWARAESTRLP